MTTSTNPCPCGTNKNFSDCCEPYLTGKAFPKTAEELMRSRYCAFVKQNIDYIINTFDPKAPKDYDRKSIEEWSKESQWLGLEIVSKLRGGEEDIDGQVGFIAKFKSEGKAVHHQENGMFVKRDNRWYYVDGKKLGNTIRRESPKIGPNDPCSCGSGKKFKKCCG